MGGRGGVKWWSRGVVCCYRKHRGAKRATRLKQMPQAGIHLPRLGFSKMTCGSLSHVILLLSHMQLGPSRPVLPTARLSTAAASWPSVSLPHGLTWRTAQTTTRPFFVTSSLRCCSARLSSYVARLSACATADFCISCPPADRDIDMSHGEVRPVQG